MGWRKIEPGSKLERAVGKARDFYVGERADGEEPEAISGIAQMKDLDARQTLVMPRVEELPDLADKPGVYPRPESRPCPECREPMWFPAGVRTKARVKCNVCAKIKLKKVRRGGHAYLEPEEGE